MRQDVQAPVLDREVAEARVGGDTELLRELAQLFLEEYPRLVAELRAAHAAGDARGMERSAHGLKGSVANFGARQAVEVAYKIERLGKDGQLASAGELLPALDLILLALHAELEAF